MSLGRKVHIHKGGMAEGEGKKKVLLEVCIKLSAVRGRRISSEAIFGVRRSKKFAKILKIDEII